MRLVLVFCVLVLGVLAQNDLHYGVSQNDLDAVKAALAAGGDINRQGPGKQTPIMSATLQGHTSIVDYLLKQGADVTIGEAQGYTPMHGAGFQGRADVANLLLEAGLSATEFHEDGFAAFHRACWGREQRHADTVEAFLAAGVPFDLPSSKGKTCADMTSNDATLEVLRAHQAREL